MDKTKTLLRPKTLPDGAGESSRLEGGIDIFALTGFMSLKQTASREGKEKQDAGKEGEDKKKNECEETNSMSFSLRGVFLEESRRRQGCDRGTTRRSKGIRAECVSFFFFQKSGRTA